MKQLLVLIAIIFAVGCDNPITPDNYVYYTNQSGEELKLFDSGKFEWKDMSGHYTDISDSFPGRHPYSRVYLFEKDTVVIMYVNYEGEDLAYVSTDGISFITYKKQK